ncbi:hypothetical protein, partial [Corynebacterium tuscaniense]|uniref:hypothetical protein n=1 Tax=Corynebacterium tuscaniense TaxID=302449 RepID=UPI001CA56CAA
CKTLHTPTQQTKPKAMQTQVKGTINARFPTAISPQPVSIRLSGGALSVTLTHIKLHTPTQQHKPAGEGD